MRSLNVFESISIDGYYKSSDGDLSWAHEGADDPEFAGWIANNASGGGDLLMGRVTYDMMVKWWPTPEAKKQMPDVAKGMNEATKWIASKSSPKLAWENAKLLEGPLVEAMAELKKKAGKAITVLGSGTIVAQLAAAKLVDRYQLVVIPKALGSGKTLFEKVPSELQLVDSRTFRNGRVVLTYARSN